MAVALLDVNVLVALGWSDHKDSAAAHHWMRANAVTGWATCTLTQLGFIRLSMNHHVVGAAYTSAEAYQVLHSVLSVPGHVFWPEIEPAKLPSADWAGIRGYRQVTDLYLALLARHYGGRLVTFDRALANLLPSHVEVI